MLILHAHAHGLSFAAAVENVACGAGRRGGRIDVVAADVVVVAVETVAWGAGRRGRWSDVAAADVVTLVRWRRSAAFLRQSLHVL